MTKEYAAFISHSSEDRQIADSLKELLEACDLEVYIAKENLFDRAPKNWVKDITRGIQNSTAFIPVLTPNSARRPWVPFEAGVAHIKKNTRVFPVHIESVNPESRDYSPIVLSRQSYNLSEADQIEKLIPIVYQLHKTASNRAPSQAVKRRVIQMLRRTDTKPMMERLMKLSSRKSVFIAGNVPDKINPIKKLDPIEDEYIKMGTRYEAAQSAFPTICKQLTNELLENRFVVGSCPEVNLVGASVASAAEKYALDKNQNLAEIFEIGGLYGIVRPKEPREKLANPSAWTDVHMAFRQSYMKKYQLLIIVGGNNGSYQEYQAAKEAGIPVTSLKFLKGTGERIWNELPPEWQIQHGKHESWTNSSAETFVKGILASLFGSP